MDRAEEFGKMLYSTESSPNEATFEDESCDFSTDNESAWAGLSSSAQNGQTLESVVQNALKKGSDAGNKVSPEEIESIMTQMLEGTSLAEIKNIPAEALEVLYSVAYRFYTSGNFQKAALFFQNLILLNHWDKRYTYGLAACLQGMKMHEEALNIYSAMYFLDSGNPELSLNAGLCQLALGHRTEALDGFQMVLEIARGKPEHKATFDRAEALIAHVQNRQAQSQRKNQEKKEKGEATSASAKTSPEILSKSSPKKQGKQLSNSEITSSAK